MKLIVGGNNLFLLFLTFYTKYLDGYEKTITKKVRGDRTRLTGRNLSNSESSTSLSK